MIVADPWYDYLALPVAPVILFVQVVTATSARRVVKVPVGVAATTSIAAMLVYVMTLDLEDEGANIGGGLLAIALLVSAPLLGWTLWNARRESRSGAT